METTTFILDRKKFNTELVSIKKLTPKFFKTGVAQIHVLPEQIELHVVGITKYISAQTEGYFDVFIPLRLLYAYSSTITTPELKYEVKNGEISVEEAIKKVKQDYEKMKSGEKEGKFVTPSETEQIECRERNETNL